MNNNQEEESFTKSSNVYENQIENLKNEYAFQTQKKNKEFEELFEQMDEENKELKKEIVQTKFELEEEKEKSKNIKNTFYNINNNINNNSINRNQHIEEVKNSEPNNTEYNYIFLNNNI